MSGRRGGGGREGFVADNLVFRAPYYAVEVTHVPDVVALLVYVLVGAVTTSIVSLRQREASQGRQQELEAVTSTSVIGELGLDAALRTTGVGLSRVDKIRCLGADR